MQQSAEVIDNRIVTIVRTLVASDVDWWRVCYSTLVAALPREYAATADPYLGHTVGPITGYGVSRSSFDYWKLYSD